MPMDTVVHDNLPVGPPCHRTSQKSPSTWVP
jgi:hypothetical protein